MIAGGGSRHIEDEPVSRLSQASIERPAEHASAAGQASIECPAESVALQSSSASERNQAWRALYDDQFSRIYRLVCRFGMPPAEVEDVTQQVFLIAYKRLFQVDEIRSVRGWLRGIAVRVVSDHHRWRKVRRVKQWLVESTFGGKESSAPTPERGIEVARTRERVGAALRRMSPKLRSVLVLCDIEECTVSEAAEALEIPVNTVRSRRRLARQAFQRIWEETEEEQR